MTEKDAVFLLAKVNLTENLCVHQVALLSMLHAQMAKNLSAKTVIETMEANTTEMIRLRSRVQEGDVERMDPLELQREMMRQVGPLFERVRDIVANYQGEK